MLELKMYPQNMTPGELEATGAYLSMLAQLRDPAPTVEKPAAETAFAGGPIPDVSVEVSDSPALYMQTCGRAERSAPPPPPPPVPDAPSDCEPAAEEPAGTPPTLDADGLPWDARIHASSKAIVADGTWRKKRGVEDSVVAQVTAELRGVQVPMPPPSATVPVPPPPAVPPVPAAPGAPIEPQPQGFAQVMPRITAALQAGTTDMGKIAAACQAAGIPALPALAGMPHLIPTVLAALGLDHE